MIDSKMGVAKFNTIEEVNKWLSATCANESDIISINRHNGMFEVYFWY